jgi:hypothetical protein
MQETAARITRGCEAGSRVSLVINLTTQARHDAGPPSSLVARGVRVDVLPVPEPEVTGFHRQVLIDVVLGDQVELVAHIVVAGRPAERSAGGVALAQRETRGVAVELVVQEGVKRSPRPLLAQTPARHGVEHPAAVRRTRHATVGLGSQRVARRDKLCWSRDSINACRLDNPQDQPTTRDRAAMFNANDCGSARANAPTVGSITSAESSSGMNAAFSPSRDSLNAFAS